jgi:hypothetical protein
MLNNSNAFVPQTFIAKQWPSTSTNLLMAKKSKGFSKQKTSPTPKKSAPAEAVGSSAPDPVQATQTTEYAVAPGAEALARLRRQKVEDRNDELRQIRELKSVDRQLATSPDSAVIPERVAQRMGKRMIPFVGIPLFGVMGAFVVFWYLATYKNYEFQPALVAFSTIGILGVGLVGITFSVMSASWDDDEEGSALGFDEFKTNFDSIKGGLKRTKQNAILREKMAGLPDAEIDQAIASLDKREDAARKKAMDLKEKLAKDLE